MRYECAHAVVYNYSVLILIRIKYRLEAVLASSDFHLAPSQEEMVYLLTTVLDLLSPARSLTSHQSWYLYTYYRILSAPLRLSGASWYMYYNSLCPSKVVRSLTSHKFPSAPLRLTCY